MQLNSVYSSVATDQQRLPIQLFGHSVLNDSNREKIQSIFTYICHGRRVTRKWARWFGSWNSPCKICCCKPTACNCCNRCSDAGDMASAANIGLGCCGGFGRIGGATVVAAWPILILAAAKFHKFACICCIFFCSFSFCVSANLTTSGAEQPSIVCDWCKPCVCERERGKRKHCIFIWKTENGPIRCHSFVVRHIALTLIAPMAACFDANVTNAQPLLCPFWSRNTVHSSIGPCFSNNLRTSASFSFLFNIPTNSFRSVTRKYERKKLKCKFKAKAHVQKCEMWKCEGSDSTWKNLFQNIEWIGCEMHVVVRRRERFKV